MTRLSFIKYAHILIESGFYSEKQVLTEDGLVPQSFVQESYKLLPDMADRIFGDFDDFCSRLHGAIFKKYGFKVTEEKCATCELLKLNSFGYSYDLLTDEPTCTRHEVWLDLEIKKPIMLAPDFTSLKTFIQNKAKLQKFIFAASPPTVDDKTEKLLRAL